MIRTHTITACAAASVAVMATATSGQEGGLPRLTFGVEQRFELADNLELAGNGGQTTALARTGLSFGYLDETAIQRLTLTGNLQLRLTDDPDAYDSIIEGPQLAFSYAREAATGALTIGARYRRAEIAFLRTLEDFPDGIPQDFEDLEGTGTRTAYGVDATLELGREAPIGATLSLGTDIITYDEASAALTDTSRLRAAGSLRFTLTPTLEGRARLRGTSFDEDGGTERQSLTADIGLGYDLSAISRLDAVLGYTVVETADPDQPVDREDGLTGSVTLARTVPTGTVTAGLTAETTQDGTRLGFNIGRSFELPRAAFSARIGASTSGDDSTDLVGALSWRQDLPNGSVTAELDRSVATTDDEERLLTSLTAAYAHDINRSSSMGLSLTYAESEEVSSSSGLRTASFSARYNRSLTPDWGLTLGYGLSARDEDPTDDAISNSIYVTIGREFTGRP